MSQGRLAFERSGAATAVREAYAESPLRFLTPRSRGGAAWAFTSTLGGGLVSGDRVAWTLHADEGAQAFVASQGPTRVFRGTCATAIDIRAGRDATLVFAPDPAACFAGASFDQRTSVDLAAGASLALWDVLSAGRDHWGFSRCRTSLAVRSEGATLLDEALLLDAAHGSFEERLRGLGSLATLLFAGPAFEGLRAAARERLRDPPDRRARLLESASEPRKDFMVLRLAAPSVEEMIRALRSRLFPIRPLLGGDPWRSDASWSA